ncbi:conserved hypothetical protein [Leishmania infantum JPCM5]|uniref:Uncharacterized protein n=2 Tax=Leishmania infantum TaxID=5671 RepID=A4IAR0_LEIIN|nr:conserved hypothetical protein [Leishmania infantum JPCM5]CAC9542474.1 hypothetical_protein_-_conserved [Leishmania infantum]CAM71918.1 conserved hypothetical protein [Leishmania infantum JPCM5]SUZ45840.1 hypothetical_protein_-_conserved [Leishmania infantum]|eukprot:XP_001468829.1 conserved hypothetical protein [Leishmania infantum JPCM5]
MSLAEESARRRVRRLAGMGKYELAEELLQSDCVQSETALSAAAMQLERDGAHQWNALQRAEGQYLLQQRRAASQEKRVHLERLLRSQAERRRADEEELARFAASETVKLQTMPIAVPREVLVLQQQETELRWEGSFSEAAKRRRDAARLERELLGAYLLSRGSLLEHRITRQAAALLKRETIALEKDDASMAALQAKHAGHRRCAVAQLRHIEDGMLAAQSRTHRYLQETRARNGMLSATHTRTQRGTALERRVYGDAYRLPSLCELYGSLMEERPSTSPAV